MSSIREARLEAALQDFADHGLRADLTPTMMFRDAIQVYNDLSAYLQRIDGHIRSRARAALDDDASPAA